MRYSILCALVFAGACGTSSSDSGITLKTKDITLQPGQETTYCYYLHTHNTEPAVISKWESELGPGSHHMAIYENPSGYQKADDMYDTPCPIIGRSQPVLLYATQTPGHDEWDVPNDDGTGKPLGQLIKPNTAVYVQMHFINETDKPIPVHIEAHATLLPKGVDYTPTAGFMTYNNSIMIPPGATNHVEAATCQLPANVHFWALTTHSHKQSIHTQINDGAIDGTMIYENADWQHPPTKFWESAPFQTFQSPTISWSCTYNNTGDNAATTVYAGGSSATDEMCVVDGFYFPASDSLACIWDTTVPGGCFCSTTGG